MSSQTLNEVGEDAFPSDPNTDPLLTLLDEASQNALPRNARSQTRRHRQVPWVSVLIFPSRVAVGALTFAMGYTLTLSLVSPPLSILSGLAFTATGQLFINALNKLERDRDLGECTEAETVQLQRMHWLDAVQAVGKIIDLFSKGLGRPEGLDSMRCIFLDVSLARLVHCSTLQQRLRIARTRPQTRMDVLEAGRHYLDFALASYGFILLRLTDIIHPEYDIMVQGTRSVDVALHMLQLSQDDMIISDLDGEEINVPRHFVAYDHARQAVVVSIRGTNSISDIITDLICGNEPFAGGYAHSGMKSSAERFCACLKPVLRPVFERHPRYSLILTGHSLGAGVAILLTKLLQLEGFSNVKCYAFAPCPVFGPLHKVDTEWSDALECFVLADDMVATLCLSSARSLALEVERIDKKISLSVTDKRQIINNNQVDVIEELLKKSKAVDPDPREKDVDQLHIPCLHGIHWVIPEEGEEMLTDDPVNRHGGMNCTNEHSRFSLSPASEAINLQRKFQKHRRWVKAQRRKLWKKKVESLFGVVPPSYIPVQRHGSYIVRPRLFEKILVTPDCVNSHFPNLYTSAFAGLDLPQREFPKPPKTGHRYTQPWYSNELG